MKEIKIYCPDIECGSCIKLIDRRISKISGVEKISFSKDSLDVSYNEELVSPHQVSESIKQLGFRADFVPFSRKTFSERWRDFKENKIKYEIEYKMLKYGFYAMILLAVLELGTFFLFFRNNQLIGKNLLWIFYLDLAVVSIGAAIWHLNSYRQDATIMIGMMIGMTFGMQTGLMIGTIIGATNGMFTGTMSGMFFGVAVGWFNGKCCGIMGVLEGAMAGVMSGTMGAMIGVMLSVDRILVFMPFFMAINLIIMWGFSYMLFEEMVEDNPKIEKKKISFLELFSYCFIALVLLVLIIIYAPKSGIARIA